MKQFIACVLVGLMAVGCFAGCMKVDDSMPTEPSVGTTDVAPTESVSDATVETTESTEPTMSAEEAMTKVYLDSASIDLLYYEQVPIDDAEVKGYLTMVDESETVGTVMTVGVRLVEKAAANYIDLSRVEVAPKDESIVYTTYRSAWVINDCGYGIMTIRCAGAIDPDDFEIVLRSKYLDMSKNRSIDSLEESATFADYIALSETADKSPIVKMAGRHYIFLGSWWSVSESSSDGWQSQTKTMVFAPLDGPLVCTMTDADVTLSLEPSAEKVDSVTLTAFVDGGEYSGKYPYAPVYQTLVHLMAKTNDKSDEGYDALEDAIAGSVVTMTDADGNSYTLHY